MADHQEAEGIAAVYRDDERLGPLIGPGGPFEVHDVVLDGVPLRAFVRAPRTVVDAFDLGVAHAERTQIVHEDERLTFAEVRARSLALARELQSSFGVRPGDRVAIAMRNLPEFVISFWGAALVGAIVVPLNSWWQGPELNYALQDAGAVVAFVDDARRDRVIADGRPADLQLVSVRTDGGDVSFDDLVQGEPVDESGVARPDPDDPVTILYTSGTTGRPKGALGTHRGAIANIWNMAFGAARESLIAGRRPDPSVQPASLSAAPLFHIGGVAAIIGSRSVVRRSCSCASGTSRKGSGWRGRSTSRDSVACPPSPGRCSSTRASSGSGWRSAPSRWAVQPSHRIFPSGRCRCSARACNSSTATG
jgi:non-ribosomal peptide synthetase component F